MSLKKRKVEQEYNFTKIGSFGIFATDRSFPIEYVATQFSISELDKLTMARDISPDKLDFDLLIQRDIDEERVHDSIMPYIMPTKKVTLGEMQSKAVFFPPLLAAIVPVENKKMQVFYPNETGMINLERESSLEDQKPGIEREWGGFFRVEYYSSNMDSSPEVEVFDSAGQNIQSVKVDSWSELNLKLVAMFEKGAVLIVIDGQHRLSALKRLYENKRYRASINKIIVPVCILFPPRSTEYWNNKVGYRIPSVPEVFRKLFVDVNSNMVEVGGHFNILLSDNNISSLSCRQFCDNVLTDESLEEKGLAVIEWNTRTKKQSTVITRRYSLTSIGIIDEALSDSLGEDDDLLEYVLNIPEIEEDLYPEGDPNDESDYPKVQWKKFSLGQKYYLKQQVDKYIVPILRAVFFKIAAFKSAYDIFLEKTDALDAKRTGDNVDLATAADIVWEKVFEYKEFDKKEFKKAFKLYKEFEFDIQKSRDAKCAKIIEYALYQRAIIKVFFGLTKIASTFNLSIDSRIKIYLFLVDSSLKNRGELFDYSRKYMQYSVFKRDRIRPTNDAKDSLMYLTYARLLSPGNIESVVELSCLENEESKRFAEKLAELGNNAVAEFMRNYQNQRAKVFKKEYRVDDNLSEGEVDRLKEAEKTLNEDKAKLKQKTIEKEDVSKEFEKLVASHVSMDKEVAADNLQTYLNLEFEIYTNNV